MEAFRNFIRNFRLTDAAGEPTGNEGYYITGRQSYQRSQFGSTSELAPAVLRELADSQAVELNLDCNHLVNFNAQYEDVPAVGNSFQGAISLLYLLYLQTVDAPASRKIVAGEGYKLYNHLIRYPVASYLAGALFKWLRT
jgi:hypothetical protein